MAGETAASQLLFQRATGTGDGVTQTVSADLSQSLAPARPLYASPDSSSIGGLFEPGKLTYPAKKMTQADVFLLD